MLDSSPPYKLLSSICTYVLNYVRSPLDVKVEDLRPRDAEITRIAVYDIRLCEKIFDNWATQLDKATSSSKKPDDREQELRFYLRLLREDAGWCSNATNEILKVHVQFASLMAQRIDDASESQYRLKYEEKTMSLANDISEASRSLSIYVTKMKDNLNSLVSTLERIQVTVKEERSLVERILGWLESLFKAIARILVIFCPPISAHLFHSAEPKVQKAAFVVSTLGVAATTFCAAYSEPQDSAGKVSESLDNLILFLKKIVPKEAQDAQERLERFDEVFNIMGVESHMRAGRRVTLYGPDLAAIAKEWRDVAERFQSWLPDDNF